MPRIQFATDYSQFKNTRNGEPLTAFTLGTYKQALNTLARAGYATAQSLLDNQEDICTIIDALPTVGKRKVYLSAIFKVLNREPLEAKKGYYDSFQKCKFATPTKEKSESSSEDGSESSDESE